MKHVDLYDPNILLEEKKGRGKRLIVAWESGDGSAHPVHVQAWQCGSACVVYWILYSGGRVAGELFSAVTLQIVH